MLASFSDAIGERSPGRDVSRRKRAGCTPGSVPTRERIGDGHLSRLAVADEF